MLVPKKACRLQKRTNCNVHEDDYVVYSLSIQADLTIKHRVGKEIVMPDFPDCFPADFESEILPKNVEYKAYPVYRVLKRGILNREAFISSAEEFPRRFHNSRKAAVYSTSCFQDYNEIHNIMMFTFRDRHPEAILAYGATEPECGPCKKSDDPKSSHVDWWLYQSSHPEDFFEEVR